MKINFHKYEGAGNDFIIIDNRQLYFDQSNQLLIQQMCDRKKGIGADGLILLQSAKNYNFEMRYFNADGRLGSMCGNGGRCIVDFAKQLGLFDVDCRFLACDGEHKASWSKTEVSLRMQDVQTIELGQDFLFLDTGSPHFVRFVKELDDINVFEEGRKIRYNDRFRLEGTNVNFVQLKNDALHVRTYERGVEDETLACGTGVVASVLSAFESGLITNKEVLVSTLGGQMKVSFENNKFYTAIDLIGPYRCVFKGEIVC